MSQKPAYAHLNPDIPQIELNLMHANHFYKS